MNDDCEAEMNDDEPDLGRCCICEKAGDITLIVTLPRRCVVPGHGWGCFECGLPSDGAMAVICRECEPIYLADHDTALRFFCRSYPGSEGRISIDELPEDHFDHDEAKHAQSGGHHGACRAKDGGGSSRARTHDSAEN